ncbi:protein asunder [Phlebotomus papatasi]|uniref:protein asunder n=1 Tax=Phlebotomus papatasi TaxID=29031 RepID=UPI00248470A3|nr:protein asunder [Phlebotomus papatasi]
MNDFNHKSVFVLDHTPYFGISSQTSVNLEFLGSKAILLPPSPLPIISKSLWTCSVEASVEYCRIVWDLFPQGKFVRFIVSDSAAHIVNTWNATTQNTVHVLNAMSMIGTPPRSTGQVTEYSVIHGLRAAIEALAEPTEFQRECVSNIHSGDGKKLINRGRIICITSARDDASMKSLEDIVHTVLIQQNSISSSHEDSFVISHVHLVIVNICPSNAELLVSNRPLRDISPIFKSEIHSVRASDISNLLTHLILSHYDLASTTVTGIPMKEEQNASSSANYDVEIFHSSIAHSVILGNELVLPKSTKEGANYETVTLKWCTPRGCGSSEMQPCLAQYRVTPVDVTSRPSSCLINFLLNGRSVLLEMPRKSGGKLTSHLLSAHGGEIFIHSLSIARSSLEDPPSISEGVGGRITDYRIPDFGMLMQRFKLIPLRQLAERPKDENLSKLRRKLYRSTKYWPITLGSTILYSVRQFVDPLLSLITKPELTDEDIIQCQQVVYNLVSLEARHEHLPLPSMGHRLKGSKKEDQYRLFWSELEILVATSGTSKGHKTVLACIRECRSRGSDSAEKFTFDATHREFDTQEATHKSNVIRATTDSPMSPPSAVDMSAIGKKFSSGENKSLLDIITASEKNATQKRLDFGGRLCTPAGQIAKLYPNLGAKEAPARDAEIK